MSALSADGLCLVRPRVSCVINRPLEDTWNVVRDWAPFAWMSHVDGNPVVSTLLEGHAHTTVGAVRRVQIGPGRVYERLVAIDDKDHVLRWQLISHPDSINPFTCSIINYVTTIKLERISMGSHTFLVWEGEFLTEPQNMQAMQQTLERWYVTGILSLQDYLKTPRPKVFVPKTPSPADTRASGGMAGLFHRPNNAFPSARSVSPSEAWKPNEVLPSPRSMGSSALRGALHLQTWAEPPAANGQLPQRMPVSRFPAGESSLLFPQANGRTGSTQSSCSPTGRPPLTMSGSTGNLRDLSRSGGPATLPGRSSLEGMNM